MVDRCCDLKDARTTKVFVKFVMLYLTLFLYSRRPSWALCEIELLREEVRNFKTLEMAAFKKYHASGLCTCKWHSLDYLADAVTDAGNMHVLHAGLYESSHRFFKRVYRRTSQRTSSVMEKTVCLRKKGSVEQP